MVEREHISWHEREQKLLKEESKQMKQRVKKTATAQKLYRVKENENDAHEKRKRELKEQKLPKIIISTIHMRRPKRENVFK